MYCQTGCDFTFFLSFSFFPVLNLTLSEICCSSGHSLNLYRQSSKRCLVVLTQGTKVVTPCKFSVNVKIHLFFSLLHFLISCTWVICGNDSRGHSGILQPNSEGWELSSPDDKSVSLFYPLSVVSLLSPKVDTVSEAYDQQVTENIVTREIKWGCLGEFECTKITCREKYGKAIHMKLFLNSWAHLWAVHMWN